MAKRHGMMFVGTAAVYSYLQVVGVINAHAIAALEEKYLPPHGRLVVALADDGSACGCVAEVSWRLPVG